MSQKSLLGGRGTPIENAAPIFHLYCYINCKSTEDRWTAGPVEDDTTRVNVIVHELQ